jgi:hypothetical protein
MRPPKVTILNEKTIENMQVLRDCVDLIIDNLPWRFDADGNYNIFGESLRGLFALTKKYAGTRYANIIKSFTRHEFRFSNETYYKKNSAIGSYMSQPRLTLTIYVSAFMRSSSEVSLTDILQHKVSGAGIQTFRGILLHELRHLFQSQLYPKFYDKDGRKEDYNSMQIEIDAAWSHHLEDFSVAEYDNVRNYVLAVMSSFSRYKSLTPEQKQHYIKKTATYWTEMTTGEKAGETSAERLRISREKFKKTLVYCLGNLSGDFDLRQLPGYDPKKNMFLLPNRILKGSANSLSSGKPISASAAPLLFTALSVTLPDDLMKEAASYLKSVYGVTVTDALAGIEDMLSTAGFDGKAVRDYVQKAFS